MQTSLNHESPSFHFFGVIIFIIASLFFLYEFFLRVFVGTLAHQIIPDLHLSPQHFALIGSAYYLAYGLMQVPVGILVDRFGVKKIMVFASLTCASSVFLFAFSTNLFFALLSRLLMGFGSSFAFICLLILVSSWFQRRYFAFLAGLSQFVGTMGPFLAGGPLVHLLLKSHLHWRSMLNQVGVFGLILTLCILVFVKNKPRDVNKIVILKRKIPLSLLIRQLLTNTQAWTIAFYSATVYVSIALLGAFWGTAYLESRGFMQVYAASIISAAWFGYALGCIVLSLISDITLKRKPYLILSAAIGLIATLWIIYVPLHSKTLYGLIFFSLGVAASGQNVAFATIAEHVGISIKATALGLNNALITLFNAFVPLMVGVIVSLSASKHHRIDLLTHDYIQGLIIMPIMYFMALIISCFFIQETFCKLKKENIVLNTDYHPVKPVVRYDEAS